MRPIHTDPSFAALGPDRPGKVLAWVLPVLVAVLAAFADRYFGLGVAANILTNSLQGSIVLGIAILFGALWIGYFLILREYLVSKSRLDSRLQADAAEAAEDRARAQAALERLEGSSGAGRANRSR